MTKIETELSVLLHKYLTDNRMSTFKAIRQIQTIFKRHNYRKVGKTRLARIVDTNVMPEQPRQRRLRSMFR